MYGRDAGADPRRAGAQGSGLPHVPSGARPLCNDDPVLIERTYIPYFLCEGIERYDFSRQSLYRVLTEQYSLQHYRASEVIEASLISKEESKLLNCSARSACYHITRVARLDTGLIYEYTDSTTRADKCVFHLDLYLKENHHVPVNIRRTLSV